MSDEFTLADRRAAYAAALKIAQKHSAKKQIPMRAFDEALRAGGKLKPNGTLSERVALAELAQDYLSCAWAEVKTGHRSPWV
jgi:hypothetical protein